MEIKRNNVVLEKVEPKTSPKQEQPSSNSEPVNTKKDVPKLDDKSIAPKNNKTDETVVRNTGRQLTSNQKGLLHYYNKIGDFNFKLVSATIYEEIFCFSEKIKFH